MGLRLAFLLGLAALLRAELAEEPTCPEEDDCDCHYFRINWVTDCSESNLTYIPHDGLDLRVYELNMNGNGLRDVDPFPEGIKLRSLKLADNLLTHIKKDTFAGLQYLVDIDLSGNNIHTIDPEAFKDSPGLIKLEIQNNPLELVGGPFLASRSLLYLYMSDCHISKLSPQFFANITTLHTLDLSGNPLRILEPGIFDDLRSLESLTLNRCNITYISNTAFIFLEHLKVLELAENNLKSVEWPIVLGPLGRLEHLDLRHSGISNLPENAFGNNTWLTRLILAENELTDLDVATTLGHNLIHLSELDLSNCHLKGPLSEDAFANATNLKVLYLAGNHLSAADLAVALAPLVRLQVLSLRNCGLTRFPANTFHRFTCLQELDISRNPLNGAFTALLSPLETLEHLNMGYSNLEHISKNTFERMTSLKTLILSGNRLKSLESGLFQNLTHLKTLELNNCGLGRLNETVFFDNYTYPDLEELRLSGNPLEIPASGSILPHQLSRLRILDLSNCNITHLTQSTFQTSRNITKLILSGNKLSNSEDALKFLEMLPFLENLDMNNNSLSHISPSVFGKNYELMTLKLLGNPWKCDCNIADMWDWASQEKGELGVLVGSTASVGDGVSSSKKKRVLTCFYDIKTSPTKAKATRPGRELATVANKTWARYVKEADCPSTNKIHKPAKIVREIRDVSSQSEFVKEPLHGDRAQPSWTLLIAGSAMLMMAVVALFLTASMFLKKKRTHTLIKAKTPSLDEDVDFAKRGVLNEKPRTLRRVVK
ncbi:unnamed protein product [Bemisia tabaci]|uniref:Uncharacterized protein n=1 Tax=Bemisia tabaci TaxID=7038 RepID=A0A9P0FZM3_BEMTA|nr:unnamed protein product [Bemisia tabaci]